MAKNGPRPSVCVFHIVSAATAAAGFFTATTGVKTQVGRGRLGSMETGS